MNEEILKIAKLWTGSIMSSKDIYEEYKGITKPKRRYLNSLASKEIENIERLRDKYSIDHILNTDIDSNISILTVNLNIIAAETHVDPAIVFLSAIDKRNRK